MKTILGFFLLLTLSATAQTNPPFIDTLFYGKNGLQNKRPGMGISLGIYQDGEKSFYSFGNRSRTDHHPIDSNTVFEIGSNTKIFTALLLASKIVKNEIAKGATIDCFLPPKVKLQAGLKNKVRMIDLASYSSGLPTLHDDVYDSLLLAKDTLQPYAKVDETYLYDILQNTEELNGYGSYEYSNFAYGLLGSLLQRCSKTRFSKLLQKDLLTPLGLKNTWIGKVGHSNVAGGFYEGREVGYLQLDALKPAGALKSDAVDMLRFIELQLNPPVDTLGEAMLLTQKVFLPGEGISTGLGWHIIEEEEGQKFYFMQGDTIGNSSLMFFNQETHVGIVILLNQSDHDLTGVVLDYLLRNLVAEK